MKRRTFIKTLFVSLAASATSICAYAESGYRHVPGYYIICDPTAPPPPVEGLTNWRYNSTTGYLTTVDAKGHRVLAAYPKSAEWAASTKISLDYTKLPPGEYTRITGRNDVT